MFGLRRRPVIPELNAISSAADFHALIRHECRLADRHGQGFSLVVLDVGTTDLNSLAARQLVRSLYRRFRTIDDIGWFSANQIGVFLPYTSAEGALRFATDVTAPFAVHTYPSPNWPVLPKFNWRYLMESRLLRSLNAESTVRGADDFRSLVTLERDRADRNGHLFSLPLLNTSQISAQGVSVNGLIAQLNSRLRLTDVVGWYDDSEIGILLPYASQQNATRVIEKLGHEYRISLQPHCAIYTYPGRWIPGALARPSESSESGAGSLVWTEG